MEEINIQNQGMLKMLQDLCLLLKNGKQDKACNIRKKIGLEKKHWSKLRNYNLVILISKVSKPIYKWNTIEPNIYMAIETLKDYPNYDNSSIRKADEFYNKHESNSYPLVSIKEQIWAKEKINEFKNMKGITTKMENDKKIDESYNQYEQNHILYKCLNCGRFFKPQRSTAKYCSELCRKQYNRAKGKAEKIKNNEKEVLFNIPEAPKQENIIPPKLEWVEKFCNQRKNNIYPPDFMAFYNNNGWKVKANGKLELMKDWKRAIYTWEKRDKQPKIINMKLSETSDNDLVSELKKRGYSGNVSKEIKL